MCGIAGILKLSGPATSQDVLAVLRMMDAEVHRGPDDWGILFPDSLSGDSLVRAQLNARGSGHGRCYVSHDSGVSAVLGCRRLSILDLSDKARMPMGTVGGRTWITYNGEIYNFRELRSQLLQRGYSFRSDSDTEVLLYGYEEWGEDLLPRLRGMFACALLRTAAEPALLLAKDRFGIKPLYYFADGERLLFASEVRALMASGLIPHESDVEAMVRFLQLGSVPVPLTTVRGVRALPAAHLLACGRGQFGLRQYWDLNQCFRSPQDEIADATARVLPLLTDSVRAHSVSDVPLGIFLSGGIDSSSLVALASLAGQRPIKTVSVTFEEEEFDESVFARGVARMYGTEHGEVCLTRRDFFHELPRIFDAMDQPTVDGVNTYFVSKAAKAFGLTVVFAGTGADEIFLGYQHLKRAATWDMASQVMARIPRPLRQQIVRSAYNAGLPFGRREKLTYLNSPTRENIYLLFRGLFGPQQIQHFLGITEREVRDIGMCIPNSRQTPEASFLDSLVSLEFHHYLQNQLLKDTDFMSMSHSIEARVPYLDPAVVEFVLGVPAAQRLRGQAPKPLLVNALGDRLPRNVWDRPKRGFTFPFGEWMRSDLGMLEADVQSRRLFDSRAVKDIWAQFRQGGVHWSRPWALSVLARAMEAPHPAAAAAAGAAAVGSPSVPIEVVTASARRQGAPSASAPAAPRPLRGIPGAERQHVLVLLSDLLDAVGGIQTFNRSLVKALDSIAAERRWRVELLVLNDRRRDHYESRYFNPEQVSCRAFRRGTAGFALAAVHAARRATTAIIGHVNFCPVLPLMKVAAPGLHSALVVHGIEVWKPLPWLQRWGVRHLDEVLTVSDFTRDEMRLHNDVNGLAFTTFPDTLDPFYSAPDVSGARTRLGLPAGPMLLSVSRLHRSEFYKRIDLVIEAMPAVLKQVPHAFLVVVGEGSDLERLRRLAAQLGIDDRVRFAGRVSEDELPLYYEACDVFVLPSLKEGFGIVFLEAMQYAKPCIGARAAAVPEVILDGETGLLAAPGDPRSLERAIVTLLADEGERRRMGEAGLLRLQDHFAFAMFRARLEEVLCRRQA